MSEIYVKKSVGWIKEANKLGKYRNSYYGFRIYAIVEASHTEEIEEREDGMYRITRFTAGEYVAVDRYGVTYKGDYWSVIQKIEFDVLNQNLGK